MPTTAFFPQGTKLKRKNPSTGVYEDIPGITSVGFGTVESDFDDITSHDSASGVKEKAPTLKDAGKIQCELIFNPANALHQGLFTDNLNNTKLTWRVVLPNVANSTTEFDAYVTGLDLPATVKENMRLSFALERTGLPTFTW